MFFTTKKADLIQVQDDFATLKELSENGDMVFEFVMSLKQLQLFQAKAFLVNVKVYTQSSRNVPMVPASTLAQIDTRALLSNVLLSSQNLMNSSAQQDNYVVFRTNIDVSSHIDNTAIINLRGTAATFPPKIQLKNVAAKDIKSNNENVPVFQSLAFKTIDDIQQQVTASLSFDPSAAAYAILADGFDPASIVDLTPRSIEARQALHGILRPIKSRENIIDPITQLLEYYVAGQNVLTIETDTTQLSNDTMQIMQVSEVDDTITVPFRVALKAIPNQPRPADVLQYFVSFYATGAQEVIKTIDVQKQIVAFLYPETPPKITVQQAQQKVLITLEQADLNADVVLLYKKVLYNDVYQSAVGYDLVGKYALSYGKSLVVNAEIPTKSIVVYRAIASLGVSLSPVFSSAVLVPSIVPPKRNVTLVTTNTETGVGIELRFIPHDVISVQFVRKNLSLFDADYSAVNDPIFIDDTIRALDSVSTIDISVQQFNSYEYAAQFVFKNGDKAYSLTSLISYVGLTTGFLTTLDNVIVTQDSVSPNVTFDYHTTMSNNDADSTLELLKQAGLSDVFFGDISGSRDDYKGLIAHSIDRVNLSTGLRESFGVITTSSFSDQLFRNNTVEPLEYGNRYRYEVFVLIRDISTLFPVYLKSATDSRTNKTYTYNALKFFHPVVAKEGMLVTAQGLQQNFAQNALEHGLVGLSTSYEVSFDNTDTKILSAAAVKTTRDFNSITWKIQGDAADIDHFLIIKEMHGIRTMLAATHGLSSINKYQHRLTPNDIGSFRYVIIPVYSDYSVGVEVKTNFVVIDP